MQFLSIYQDIIYNLKVPAVQILLLDYELFYHHSNYH